MTFSTLWNETKAVCPEPGELSRLCYRDILECLEAQVTLGEGRGNGIRCYA